MLFVFIYFAIQQMAYFLFIARHTELISLFNHLHCAMQYVIQIKIWMDGWYGMDGMEVLKSCRITTVRTNKYSGHLPSKGIVMRHLDM